jgi:hypothetical protein
MPTSAFTIFMLDDKRASTDKQQAIVTTAATKRKSFTIYLII